MIYDSKVDLANYLGKSILKPREMFTLWANQIKEETGIEVNNGTCIGDSIAVTLEKLTLVNSYQIHQMEIGEPTLEYQIALERLEAALGQGLASESIINFINCTLANVDKGKIDDRERLIRIPIKFYEELFEFNLGENKEKAIKDIITSPLNTNYKKDIGNKEVVQSLFFYEEDKTSVLLHPSNLATLGKLKFLAYDSDDKHLIETVIMSVILKEVCGVDLLDYNISANYPAYNLLNEDNLHMNETVDIIDNTMLVLGQLWGTTVCNMEELPYILGEERMTKEEFKEKMNKKNLDFESFGGYYNLNSVIRSFELGISLEYMNNFHRRTK